MKLNKSIILTTLIALLASPALLADWTEQDPADYTLSAPPKEGTAKAISDFKTLHKYEETRTTEQCKFGNSQSIMTFKSLFGPNTKMLTKEETDSLEPFMTDVIHVAEKVSAHFKTKYMRLRPYDADQTLTPCARKPGGQKAYPSSHAAAGLLSALVLKKVFPDRAQEIEDYGYEIGEYRAIVGVHHPSDIEAGQSLAKQIMTAISKDASFKKELGNAKEALE